MTKSLFDVSGRVALVTGGSRGIGRMIAEGLVRAGATVYVTSRKADACRATAAELGRIGTCVDLPADLTVAGDRARLVAELQARHPALDILVNNAGTNWGAPIAATDEHALEKVLSLNVKALFHITRDLLPMLDAAGTPDEPARIVNVGSIAGLTVPAQEAYVYSASKAAVHHLTRHLARALAPTITVNAIAPGPFESQMMAVMPPGFREGIERAAPLQRIGRPDDVAGATIFLTSRAGAYVTGTVLAVDGGLATTA